MYNINHSKFLLSRNDGFVEYLFNGQKRRGSVNGTSLLGYKDSNLE